MDNTVAAASNNTSEAYKSVIDFNKTIISMSSAILAALIGYLVYQKVPFRLINYVSVFLLVVSIFLSILGFGQAIKTIKDSVSRKATIGFTNWGAFFLILGILAILAVKDDEKTIDNVLNTVEKNTTTLAKNLSTKNCVSIELKSDSYFLVYHVDSSNIEVIYSLSKQSIVSIK